MIKFFRKIRQDLLNRGKTGKYLKYAIGEIVLLVIGILIALQINNWNEHRKNRILELTYLDNIKADLNLNLTPLKNLFRQEKYLLKLQIVFLNFLKILNC
ncbi:MAG: hypothetical protein DRI75_02020 [Bacteroidetes bacterium]|nr:MAG: hypothetical protein DRI75_02020 [Bacteroidota bacterium]